MTLKAFAGVCPVCRYDHGMPMLDGTRQVSTFQLDAVISGLQDAIHVKNGDIDKLRAKLKAAVHFCEYFNPPIWRCISPEFIRRQDAYRKAMES